MKEFDKLIVTATTANSWIHPELKNWAQTIDELIEEVVKCYEAGAAIAHVHLPRGEEIETVKRIRERCDVIIQAGMSSYPIKIELQIFMQNQICSPLFPIIMLNTFQK